MKLRTASFTVLLLFTACSISADADRKYVVLPRPAEFKGVPFSDGVLVGDVLYVGGHIGIDPKTGKAGITAEEDAKFAMDGVQQTIEAAGMAMDDLASVQIFCTSAADYAIFNSVYRKYFRGDYPARTFVQVGKILGDSRFEVQGIAIRRTK
jgi:2-iminobutanoate/2-iminopropanoate deaminase